MRNVIYKIQGEESRNKGILAADESSPTIARRLASVGVDSTEGSRHSYRHTLFSAEGLENYIGGVILFDETIRNEKTIQPLVDKGICLGIKVDKGAKPYDLQGLLTEGLDGLSKRLYEYKNLGAEFAKWRAVLNVEDSDACVIANAWTLARYAKKCQDEGIVPIVEPEVLMDGRHHITDSLRFTEKVLHHVFDAVYYEGVALETMILKPNMILNGYNNSVKTSTYVSELTTDCFKRTVPAAVPMIAFLSGGQPDGMAVENLNAINQVGNLPWYTTFSFGRELQTNSLSRWAEGKLDDAKDALLLRAGECCQATLGELE